MSERTILHDRTFYKNPYYVIPVNTCKSSIVSMLSGQHDTLSVGI